jgi:hypothetical protein
VRLAMLDEDSDEGAKMLERDEEKRMEVRQIGTEWAEFAAPNMYCLLTAIDLRAAARASHRVAIPTARRPQPTLSAAIRRGCRVTTCITSKRSVRASEPTRSPLAGSRDPQIVIQFNH